MFKNKHPEIPKGIQWIKTISYFGIFGAIFMLGFLGILQATPLSGFFADLFNPILTSIFAVISIVAWIFVIVGIKKRTIFFWKFTLIWLVVYWVYALISNIRSIVSLNITNLFGQVIWLGIIIIFLGYIYKRKDYYSMSKLPAEFPADKTEKIFKIVLITLIVLLFAISMFLPKGIELYNLSKYVRVLGEDRFNPEVAISICEGQEGTFRDFCLIQTLSINAKKYEFTPEYCEKMAYENYYDGCQLMFYNCEKIGNEQTKKVCEQLKQLASQ